MIDCLWLRSKRRQGRLIYPRDRESTNGRFISPLEPLKHVRKQQLALPKKVQGNVSPSQPT
jgi:hypothetical protein